MEERDDSGVTGFQRAGPWVMAAAAGCIIALLALMAAVPPVSRDALAHHLAVPKLYLLSGGVVELPHIIFSYYPMNLQMLYTAALLAGNDILPKYIHMAFGLATGGLIYVHLKRRLGIGYALAGFLLFLTLPIVVRLCTVVYVDLGLIFFSTASLLLFLRWLDAGMQGKDLIWSALCCGLCMGTKYNGLIVLFIMTSLVAVCGARASRRGGGAGPGAMMPAIYFAVLALAVMSPWLVRNWLWTGNPLYPLFSSFFQAVSAGESSGGGLPALDHFSIRHFGYGESWPEIALVPLRIFFQGADHDPRLFDGRLNPYLLLLPAAAALGWKHRPGWLRREIGVLAGFSLLFILIVFLRIDMRVRWVLPAIPPLVILGVYGMHGVLRPPDNDGWPPGRAKAQAAVMLIILVAGGAMNLHYIGALYQRIAPLDVTAGRLSRQEYIALRRPEAVLFDYANRHFPPSSKMLCLFLGGRIYYSDLPVAFHTGALTAVLQAPPDRIGDASGFARDGITHVLLHWDLFGRWLHDNYTPDQIRAFQAFSDRHLELIRAFRGYRLFAVN